MKKGIIVLLLLVLAGGAFWYIIFYAPNNFEGDRIVTVSRGENFPQVLDSLYDKGVISNRLFFEIAARYLHRTTRIQIGRYHFKSGLSNSQILEDLQYGISVEWITVSVPEGMTSKRQARWYRRHLGIDSAKFMSFVLSPILAKELGSETETLEGYLLPGTYKFYWQTDERLIVRTMVEDFWRVYNDSIRSVVAKAKTTFPQVLTLASIVEGETRIDSERGIVAGVYLNRLKKKIPLQADPTIQYLIPDGPRVLRHEDTRIQSPYNTYMHLGLPPGPVNNPGRAAIEAVLHPKKVPYLYFVANGRGGHTFTRTYQEHLRAVKNYKKFREEERAAKESAK